MDVNIPIKYLHHTVGISAAVFPAVERPKSLLQNTSAAFIQCCVVGKFLSQWRPNGKWL